MPTNTKTAPIFVRIRGPTTIHAPPDGIRVELDTPPLLYLQNFLVSGTSSAAAHTVLRACLPPCLVIRILLINKLTFLLDNQTERYLPSKYPIMHPTTASTLLLFVAPTLVSAASYNLVKDYSGDSFFDGWNFYGNCELVTPSVCTLLLRPDMSLN